MALVNVTRTTLIFLVVVSFVFFVSSRVEADTGLNQGEGYIGIIKPRQIIKVGSPVTGITRKTYADRGSLVKAGQVLLQLKSEVERVDLSLAQTRYDVAEKRHQRQLQLKDQALTSEEELERASMEMQMAKFERDRRQLFLSQRTVTSPVTGVVMQRLVSQGEYIDEQTPVMVVAQTNLLNIETILPIATYGKVRKGMQAEITPEQPLQGRYLATVEVVDSVLDAASSTYGVRLLLENKGQKIPSGIKCTVKFLE